MASVLLVLVIGVVNGAPLPFTGVSLSCAEFAGNKIPGVYNKDYTFPTTAEVDYYAKMNMNVLRIPFLWERMQPAGKGDFDAVYQTHYTTIVSYATSKGMHVIVDPHNYARYYGQVVGAAGSNATTEVFADFWSKMATLFKDNDRAVFAIMNEPNTMKTEDWLEDANAAIAAIRLAGAKNLLAIPGNAWTGAHSWTQNWYGTSNAVAMVPANITDPANNFIYEVHQYLDSDSSGSHAQCAGASFGVDNIKAFAAWCKQHGVKALLGEFGAANNPLCDTAAQNMIENMEANPEVWWGWTWWAGGPWWGDYMYSIEPRSDGSDAPQWSYLKKHVQA